MEDNTLFNLIRTGREDAFTLLFNRYRELTYMLAYAKLRDYKEAEDVVQDVFTWLWVNRAKIPGDVSVKGYLVVMVRNSCIDRLRKQKVEWKAFNGYRHICEQYCKNTRIEDKEITSRLISALDRLHRPKAKSIFAMFFLEYMKQSQIAGTLGIKEQVVKNQIYKMVKVLRHQLKPALG